MCQAVRPSQLWPNTKQVIVYKIPQDPLQTLANRDPHSGRNLQTRSKLVLTSPPRNLLVFQDTTTSSSQI